MSDDGKVCVLALSLVRGQFYLQPLLLLFVFVVHCSIKFKNGDAKVILSLGIPKQLVTK